MIGWVWVGKHHESMTGDTINDSMTTSLIRQYYGWFNERRLSDAAGLFADDADVELIPGERAQGGSGYLRFAHAWVSAFPDGTFAIQQIEHRTETRIARATPRSASSWRTIAALGPPIPVDWTLSGRPARVRPVYPQRPRAWLLIRGSVSSCCA